MISENSKRTTGYPPVTATETRRAAESAAGARPGGNSNVIVDAVAGVVEAHRRRITAAALDPETKRYALGLLDAVFLDLLQTVLDETSALEVLGNHRRGPG